jgi:hypothetical protein
MQATVRTISSQIFYWGRLFEKVQTPGNRFQAGKQKANPQRKTHLKN